MSANLQPHAASLLSPAPAQGKTGHRSASLGTLSFFHSLSFFAKERTAQDLPDLRSGLDLEPAPPADLDIVGALGTLNLDDELADDLRDSSVNTSGDSTAGSITQARSSAPQVPDIAARSTPAPAATPSVPGSAVSASGAMPAPVGPFGEMQGKLNAASTPSTTWGSSFVPFSAPPFTYPFTDPALTSEMAMLIAPFQLPDDAKEPGFGQAAGKDMQPFGGVLDGRFAFENFPVDTSFEYERKDGAKKKLLAELDNGDAREFELRNFDNFMAPPVGGNNLWTQQPMHYKGLPLANDNFAQFNLFSDNLAVGNMPSRNNGYNSNHNHFGNSGGYQHNHNNRRQSNYGFNSGVNVHRKMHSSNKRKGDDASKYAKAKLEDFSGDIYSLCKDQHGCRFLQRQLDLGKDDSKSLNSQVAATMIFNEIYMRIVELMVDPFGNYLIQKLFENVSSDQRLILVKNAAPDFIRIALDPHGTRALQKLVECISMPEESRLVIDSLSPHIVSLSRDLNGNHVVQKCLQMLLPTDNQFIFDTASAHCNEIATHRHGCCVLQRCLDHGSPKQREQLSLRVAEIATSLSLDPFGNYVVQYVLSRGDEKSISIILEHVRTNIISLSLHKFGSNVIERALRIHKLTDSVIGVLLKNTDKFATLLNDPFGNYVLQTSLDVANSNDLAQLALSLQPYLANIKNTPHGRRILTKIQNI